MFKHSTWLEIDLAAIRSNIRRLQEISGKPVMAVVKGNAYGHGAVEVSRAAQAAGARWLCVSRMEEALILRKAGIEGPLLVMTPTLPGFAADAAEMGISLVVHEPGLAKELAAAAGAAGKNLAVHLKFDTGMHRLGVQEQEALDFARLVYSLPSLRVEGAMTHFARGDEPEAPTTHLQIAVFKRILSALEATGLRPPLVHAANSASALYFPAATFDMIRPGISLYGLHPDALAPLPEGFRPALSWKARLVSLKTIAAGSGVGYNYRYTTAGTERIGVCPTGYADGLRRKLNSNQVLIRGKKVSVIGSVCMDQVMIQLDSVPEAAIGDEIVLIGRQGEAEIRAEDLAAAWGTSNYEVATGLDHRLARIYSG